MKIFAIKDESVKDGRDSAFLFYYEKKQKFSIELTDDCNSQDVPLILSSFVKKRQFSIGEKWSRTWVQQRIVPAERQNIGQIIRDNRLKDYDEFKLLMLAMGRCEQDDCYLVPVAEKDLPESILIRLQKRIDMAIPLAEQKLLVFFKNGETRKYNAKKAIQRLQKYYIKLSSEELLHQAEVETGGAGITWGNEVAVSSDEVYKKGTPVPFTMEDLQMIAANSFVNAAEASEILNCSRQYISELVKKGKLHPLKKSEKNTLFLINEIRSYK